MENIVSLVRCVSYDDQEVQSLLSESLALLKITDFIKKGQTVLVKSNMFQGFPPEKCGTTHPSIVKALIHILQEVGVKVLVGDNPACLKSCSLKRYTEIADITDIKKVVEEMGARLVYPDDSIEISGWVISKTLFEVDVIVNVPKLKGHGLTVFTGAVKNIFGLIPGLRKLNYHAKLKTREQFAEMLVNLCMFVKPRLTVMDAIGILDKEGSVTREPKVVGAIISSLNPFAVDLVVVMLLRLDPLNIPTTVITLKEKVLNPKNLKIVGENPEKFQLPILEFLLNNSQHLKSSKQKGDIVPKIKKKSCVVCGACVMICPFSAIQIEKEELIIQEDLCNKCYCCLEACQFNALLLFD